MFILKVPANLIAMQRLLTDHTQNLGFKMDVLPLNERLDVLKIPAQSAVLLTLLDEHN